MADAIEPALRGMDVLQSTSARSNVPLQERLHAKRQKAHMVARDTRWRCFSSMDAMDLDAIVGMRASSRSTRFRTL